MKIRLQKSTQCFFILFILMLTATMLAACGTTEPTSTLVPTASPTAITTYTPEPATTITAETESESKMDGLLLPSPTPAPTATPGVITDMISELTHSMGVEQKTVFWVSIEDWLNLGISIIIGLILGFLVARLVYFGLEKIVARTETKHDDVFIKVIRRQISLIFIVMGFQVGTLRLPFIDVLIKRWLNQIYIAIYVVAATIILWRLLDALVAWYQAEIEPDRSSNQVDTLLLLLHRIARTTLIVISAIMLLSLYNINVNALIAALGVGGLAISLAAQDTLSNVISGIMIMVDQPFRVGDRIEIQGLGTWGDVMDIGLRTTRIRTLDNRMVIVPNNKISTDQIVNYTFPDPQYRIQIEIGIGYGQDIETVRKIIIDTVSQVEGVLKDKPVDALYVAMGDSAMIFRIRWWIESYVDARRMFDRVYTALQINLDKAGVQMPYPTYDIRVLKMPESDSNPENLESPKNNQ
ncbi:MAG TPA: hypothetical protein DEH25_03125 [Chloroflexi bacterium]|nr:hypothetical protein [Chloroflexota bacterium]